MIEELSLTNFKGHTSFNAQFPSGLTLITGPNYAGKSTILHGIVYALWGPGAVPGGAKHLATRGGRGKASARLSFYHRGHGYSVERKGTTARLMRGDALIANGASAVNEELQAVFGMPSKFFLALQYAAQGESQALLTLGAAELHRIMEHVSGVSVVDRVIVSASKMATDAKTKMELLGPAPDIVGLNYAAEQAKAAFYNEKTQREKEAAAFDHLNGHWQAASEAVRELEAAAEQAAEYDKEIARLEERLRTLHEKEEYLKAFCQDNKEAEEKAKELSQEIGKLESSFKDFSGLQADEMRLVLDQEEIEAGLGPAQDRLQELDQFLKSCAVTEFSAQREYEALLEQLAGMAEEHKTLSAAYDKSVCPECGRAYDEDERAKLEQKINVIADRYEGLEAKLEPLKLKAEKESSVEKRRRQAEMESATIYGKIGTLNDRLGKVKAQLKQVDKELAQLKAQKLDFSRLPTMKTEFAELLNVVNRVREGKNELEMMSSGIAQTLEDLASKKGQKEGLLASGKGKDLAGLRKARDDYAAELAVVRDRLSTLEKNLSRLEYEARRCDEAVEAGRQTQAALQSLNKDASSATSLTKYLRTNRDRFMADLWSQVSGYASAFASACTGGVISTIYRTDSGGFSFEERGYDADVVTASGAQRSIMSLGVQLALNAFLPHGLNTLLLDEPTSNMDPEHSVAFTQALASSGRQVIAVSHRDLDSSVAQAHIQLGF